ncbi:MAG TPA: nucleotidyltransferase domain-containing protein [Candidatus Brocadiales bacterium]|nr:nucleotidyltransferase domain-containing protein [Candidatus Brocadiales bacterium]
MKDLRLLKEKDRLAIQDFSQQVKNTLGKRVVAIKLFGSKLKGVDTLESDIDIAVIVKKGSPDVWKKVMDIVFNVNLEHDVYISPRVIPLDIFKHPVWRITPFIQTIEKEALPL